MARLLFFLFLIAAIAAGYRLGSASTPSEPVRFLTHIHPDKPAPLTEYKSFVAILYAQNDAPRCEKSLRSIFEQDYDHFRLLVIDDGSTDATFETVQKFILENQQQNRAIVIQNEQPIGVTASLERALEQCDDAELIIPLSARSRLALPTLLNQLNIAFQNPDTWLAVGQAILYPTYQILDPPDRTPQAVERFDPQTSPLTTPACFYAALAKKASPAPAAMLRRTAGRFQSLNAPFFFQEGE